MDKKKKADARTLWILFKTCFLISAGTFGGGMVMIGMLQKKFVEELKWIGQEEVMDMIAIAQSCPGVMAVNVSIIIGCRIAGAAGGLLTVFGTILPPMAILAVVSLFYDQVRNNMIVALALKGMRAGVVAVLVSVTVDMVKSVLQDGEKLSLLMLVGASAAAVIFQVDIILILLSCGIIGGITVFAGHKKELRN